ncbi:beta-ketoacyl synthase N-terminal-like domain-containing protein [Streptomyces sp. H10-C2]|uniref:beta-ketoacyl synthase N-terminal-like domain-containing protein n=1 Tax=unclassified Streptomyces TaxID=2593676 RepID=UPI0024BB18C4|nr:MULTISPECIES: beta-ketoacyl synthase N-terminal-like domain-containing protein [unclassified Streptomyces]MDJ0345170.1 beta-ketoacyl synthase N-terminal-like domain-containing protein [Streptomyces sp. PH10-H1]MDJ0374138.1 beta-ketoacyl synthase N-terminal-like domain-containing protein [Streptomyces sp. H10-C2]
MSTTEPAATERRTVVTGLGVVAPNGVGTEAFWKAVQQGVSVLGRISREGCERLPLRVAGEVREFDPAGLIEGRYLVQTDRFTHYAMAAADLALGDARLKADAESPFAIGVVTAAGSGGGEFGQGELQNLWSQGPNFVGPYQSIAWFYAASTGQISIRGGFQGPCGVLANDEAGGLDVFAQASRAIRRGTDAVVAGATEAPLAPYSVVCQLGYPELSVAEDPHRAYLPFTEDACGFSPAEGGAMFVLEEEGAARRRGARARAVVAGHCATFTGTAGWERSREGLARAIRGALDDAGCAAEDIDVVFADALGVPEADQAEVLAIADALGPHAANVPVTAPKTGFGRAYSAASALDAAAAVLALEYGVLPPTPNITEIRHDLDFVTGHPRRAALRTALVLSRGLMGCNSALVLRRA